jgi:chromosome partitioning protein
VRGLAAMPGVVNQQGGLGKTTLSMPRAHALVHTGTKVCVIDAGPPAAAPGRAASAAEGTPSSVSIVYLKTAGTKGHRKVALSDHMAGHLLADCSPAVDSPLPDRNQRTEC